MCGISRFVYFPVLFIFFLVQMSFPAYAGKEDMSVDAAHIYEKSLPAVFQIRIINKNSGEKRSCGSGFLVSEDKLFVTNYHVVSEVIKQPEKYRIEYLHENGEKGLLSIKAIDVVNDLALLKGEGAADFYLKLSDKKLQKGQRLYSLGNPHDLGMMIVEGGYNGPRKTFYEKMLFSGTLNPGVSGGPTVNEKGEVVGVNAQIEADAIGGLVPAHFVKSLLKNVELQKPGEDGAWNKIIEAQLRDSQERIAKKLITNEWKQQKLGELVIPKDIDPTLQCWSGGFSEDEKHSRNSDWLFCRNFDTISINHSFRTGRIGYHFSNFSSERLSKIGFIKHYNDTFSTSKEYNRDREKSDAYPYHCETSFLKLAKWNWKVAFCARQYKNMPDLYDTYIGAVPLMGGEKDGYRMEINLQGFTRERAMELYRKFLTHVDQK